MESFRRRCTGVRLETRHGTFESIPSGIPPDGTRNPRQRRSRFLLFSPDMHIPTIAAKAIVLAGIEQVLGMKCLLSRIVLHIVIQQIGSCPTLSKAKFSIPISGFDVTYFIKLSLGQACVWQYRRGDHEEIAMLFALVNLWLWYLSLISKPSKRSSALSVLTK